VPHHNSVFHTMLKHLPGIAPVRWTVCRLGGYVSVRAAFLSAS